MSHRGSGRGARLGRSVARRSRRMTRAAPPHRYRVYYPLCGVYGRRGCAMALTRKNLMVDAEQLAALAAWLGTSESAAVREAVQAALFAEEFTAAMAELRATGYSADERPASDGPPVS